MSVVSTRKMALFGVLLFGVALSTASVAQPIPMDVMNKQNVASAKADSVEQSIAAISLRCDKCDAAIKGEISDAKKEIAGLKQLLKELRDITDAKFVAIVKTCK
jgi:hypothetical protein